jgi:YidC/Oxa1 family membrane protein insertase
MRAIEPELRALKEKYKDKEERAKKTMELYKTHKINPFSGCLLILVQLPIIFALYYVFLKGLDFQKDLLYSWVTIPLEINPNFLGFIDIHKKSLILAILAGLSQFFLGRITLVSPKKTTEGEEKKDFQTELAKSMNMQAKYILPIFIAFVSYQISAGVALYWATSNIFTIAQEFYVRKKLKKLHLEHIKPASL